MPASDAALDLLWKMVGFRLLHSTLGRWTAEAQTCALDHSALDALRGTDAD